MDNLLYLLRCLICNIFNLVVILSGIVVVITALIWTVVEAKNINYERFMLLAILLAVLLNIGETNNDKR